MTACQVTVLNENNAGSLFISLFISTLVIGVTFFSVALAVDSADAPLFLPYKALVSTVSSMVFSEGETQRLIKILSDKAGIVQDTWHKVWETPLG